MVCRGKSVKCKVECVKCRVCGVECGGAYGSIGRKKGRGLEAIWSDTLLGSC